MRDPTKEEAREILEKLADDGVHSTEDLFPNLKGDDLIVPSERIIRLAQLGYLTHGTVYRTGSNKIPRGVTQVRITPDGHHWRDTLASRLLTELRLDPKVIIDQRVLHGSSDGASLQQVASVYVGPVEYRIYAPPKAIGNPLEWLAQMYVHQPEGTGEIEIQGTLRTQIIEVARQALEAKTQSVEKTKAMTFSPTIETRKVFVVYGRNSKARIAVFDFLRAIDLAPMEWEEVIAATGKPAPFIGEALDMGFSIAQAAVVLLTGDDVARIGKRYLKSDDPSDERTLTPQPRPNVLFEGGMAMCIYPDRTVLVAIGSYRKFTDIDGRHIVHLSNTEASRQTLADRLKTAGCAVKTEHRADWLKSGDFDGAIQDPDIPEGKTKVRLKMFKREAKFNSDATFKRKIWIEFRNESDKCLLLRQPRWVATAGGIHANIRQGTFQLQLGYTWCPEQIGTPQINLPPGDLCRLWAEPDEKHEIDRLNETCQSDKTLGSVVLFANEEEISVLV